MVIRFGERKNDTKFFVFFFLWMCIITVLYILSGQKLQLDFLSKSFILLPFFLLSFLLTLLLYYISLEGFGFKLKLVNLLELYLIITCLDFLSGQMLPFGELAGAAYLMFKLNTKRNSSLIWAIFLVFSSLAGFIVAAGLFLILALKSLLLAPIFLIAFIFLLHSQEKKMLPFLFKKINIHLKLDKSRTMIKNPSLIYHLILIQSILFLFNGIVFGMWVSQSMDFDAIAKDAVGYYISFIGSTGISVIPGVFETLSLIQNKIGLIESSSVIAFSSTFQLVFFWIPLAVGILFTSRQIYKINLNKIIKK